jgi:restriction system protein
MAYYNAQEGWVITNSTFTESARVLANKANIKLIDKHNLRRLSEFVQSID